MSASKSPRRVKGVSANISGPAKQYTITGTTTYGYKPSVTPQYVKSGDEGAVPKVWKEERPRWNAPGFATLYGEHK